MSRFAVGNIVNIPCSIAPGAFTDERLITIQTESESISGFVKTNFLVLWDKESEEEHGHVQGKIIDVTPEFITVQIQGSFFTSAAGVASVSAGWAQNNLISAA